MYVCTIIIHIIYEWHAQGEGEIVYTEKLKKVGGELTTFIIKNRLKSLLFENIA